MQTGYVVTAPHACSFTFRALVYLSALILAFHLHSFDALSVMGAMSRSYHRALVIVLDRGDWSWQYDLLDQSGLPGPLRE